MNREEILSIIEYTHQKGILRLNLNASFITELPPEIGILTDLEHLDLSDNLVTILPIEIGKLKNLRTLNISGNKIIALSREIGYLKKLEHLDISNNLLYHIPKNIGNLSKIKTLDLSDNSLIDLPPEIGNLTSLKYLDLNNNQLFDLPPEIKKYVSDQTVAAQQIPSYCYQIWEQGQDRIYEAKLIIIGEGDAGKTSLAMKIEDEKYELNLSEPSTDGINIIKWYFTLNNEEDFDVNIWDFGGQEIYHATHQFFLTKRSLYILVADNRREDTDFYYWLNIVELLSDNSPIIIAKNEKKIIR